MNSAMLLGMTALLVALVPTVYLANHYYNAYHAAREKSQRVLCLLALDKYLFTTELMNLQDDLKDSFSPGDILPAEIVCAKIQHVLDGDPRRLAEAKRAVT